MSGYEEKNLQLISEISQYNEAIYPPHSYYPLGVRTIFRAFHSKWIFHCQRPPKLANTGSVRQPAYQQSRFCVAHDCRDRVGCFTGVVHFLHICNKTNGKRLAKTISI